MRKANQVYETKLSEEPPLDLLEINREDRGDIWRQEWEQELKTLVSNTWEPVTQHVDLEVIFNCPDNASAAIKGLMRRWRTHLYECFIEAIEEATRFRDPARELAEHLVHTNGLEIYLFSRLGSGQQQRAGAPETCDRLPSNLVHGILQGRLKA
ncbi:uncharacterized protein BKCO1_1300052 [Diplodia corticola]|uniref:Uncharacterized protein n=1 Tax=Diplodia corticola TaxID=236234 RepID=A0A1J9S969_9PEZI|nr:uncharacterized protein BKCO1_1300052 [Diplodia corticola]OJD36125.1 hypothetical protein BKCO1_1300052 [Diplodia corticola]